MNDDPREPTAEECSANTITYKAEHRIGHAIWYPQMGGYVGKAVILHSNDSQPGDCFDVIVWHDGDWPFHDGQPGVELHHCNAEQFITFGEKVKKLLTNAGE